MPWRPFETPGKADQILKPRRAEVAAGARQRRAALTIFLLAFSLIYLARIEAVRFWILWVVSPAILGIALFLFSRRPFRIPGELVLYIVFVLWCSIGIVTRIDLAAFMRTYGLLIKVTSLLFIMVFFTRRSRSMTSGFLGVLIASALNAFHAVFLPDALLVAEAEERYRAMGLTSNPNTLGYFALIGLMAVAYFWGSTKTLSSRLFLLGSAGLLVSALVASASRKSFVALIITIVAWLWLCYRKELARRKWLMLPICGFLFALYFSTTWIVQTTYLGKRIERLDSSEAAIQETRTQLAVEAVEVAAKAPVFGVGLGQFRYYSRFGLYAHADVFEVLATTGFVGAIIYIAVYVTLWRRIRGLAPLARERVLAYRLNMLSVMMVGNIVVSFGRPHFYDQFAAIMLGLILGTALVAADGMFPSRVGARRKARRMKVFEISTAPRAVSENGQHQSES